MTGVVCEWTPRAFWRPVAAGFAFIRVAYSVLVYRTNPRRGNSRRFIPSAGAVDSRCNVSRTFRKDVQIVDAGRERRACFATRRPLIGSGTAVVLIYCRYRPSRCVTDVRRGDAGLRIGIVCTRWIGVAVSRARLHSTRRERRDGGRPVRRAAVTSGNGCLFRRGARPCRPAPRRGPTAEADASKRAREIASEKRGRRRL